MNALIAYYSHSGNTRRLAELIAHELGGTLLELVPETAYPADYRALVNQAMKELKAGFCPDLSTKLPDLNSYDTIFVGTPNWCGAAAPPVMTFLKRAALEGKLVVPFCTHGGGGAGHIFQDIEQLCPGAVVLPGLSVCKDTTTPADIQNWLGNIQATPAGASD